MICLEIFIFTSVQTLLAIIAISILYGFATYRLVYSERKTAKFDSLPKYYIYWSVLIALLPAVLGLLFTTVGDGIVFKYWLQSFYPNLVELNQTAKEINFIKVMNELDGITFGKPESWVVLAADAWRRWSAISSNVIFFGCIAISVMCGYLALKKVAPTFKARSHVEKIVLWILGLSSLVAILTTIGIVLSVLFETIRFFDLIPPDEFLFGLTWNPQFEGALRAGSEGAEPEYGMIPMFVGTLLISLVAVSVAVPVGLLSAMYLAEYATKRVRAIIKPLLEILAGVPTVVYGFFAALTIAPMVKGFGESLGLTVSSESALAAGLVMGVMIIPFVSSLSDDVINSVPQSLRDAAYGLGSTVSETTRLVVLPAALPGIVAAIILAVSRAIGETMIVVMAAGLAANLTFNPLDAVTTVTTQIVTILVGDQEFESAKTLSAFALALMLIIVTLVLNFFALQIVKRYREQYD